MTNTEIFLQALKNAYAHQKISQETLAKMLAAGQIAQNEYQLITAGANS